MELNVLEYGHLLAKTVPKIIETRDEFDRYVETMEALDCRAESGPPLSREEETLLALLERLVQDYDERVPLPDLEPAAVIRFLMEQKGLRQADLLPVFGSRSVASDVITGKREPSKNHIRKLAEFFRVRADVFL
jgi:HTH-type transcriptional regulator / antitoxin HigA